ncbi:MAG: DUF899 family protein, partial [Rhizomicrobium sp.]
RAHLPNESAAYRQARNALLAEEIELRRHLERVAQMRRELPSGPFDLVLLDAPCSGSGTWRRQPELKWRLTPEQLASRMALQDSLFAQAATVAQERLVYATCSILPCENQDRVETFLSAHPAFRRVQPDFHASPASTASDGFYAAFLTRGS